MQEEQRCQSQIQVAEHPTTSRHPVLFPEKEQQLLMSTTLRTPLLPRQL